MKSEYDCVITNNFTLTDSEISSKFVQNNYVSRKKTAAYHNAIDNK